MKSNTEPLRNSVFYCFEFEVRAETVDVFEEPSLTTNILPVHVYGARTYSGVGTRQEVDLAVLSKSIQKNVFQELR